MDKLPEPPYVVYSLSEDRAHITQAAMSKARATRGEPLVNDIVSLDQLNHLGLDEAARLVGKSVLASFGIWHPEVMARYPNLLIPLPDPSSLPKLPFPPEPEEE